MLELLAGTCAAPGQAGPRTPVGFRVLAACALVIAVLLTVAPDAHAAEGRFGPDGADAIVDTSDAARELLDRHRPVVMVKAQDGLCAEAGEPFVPMSPSRVLDNPQIALRQVGAGSPVVMWGPDAADLAGRGAGFYLDFPGEALRPGCLYAEDAERYGVGDAPVVLGRVVTQADRPGYVVAQYWLYWYYNDWNNRHESDWEGVQLVFEAADVAEALTEAPVETGYAQHEGGERAAWDGDDLERDGDRPVVYSSRRSHASYYGSSLFLGRGAAEGFGCDNTDGPSVRLDPALEAMPDPAVAGPDTAGWLTYEGLWGERGQGPNNGPQGPNTKLRWNRPLDWQDTLRDSAFIVPAGDSAATQLVSTFCDLVATGSNQLNSFQYSPTRTLVTFAVLVVVVRFLLGRTTWTPTRPLPLARRRSVGQILRAAAASYRRRPATLAAVGLVVLPVGLATAAIGAAATRIPLVGALVLRTENGSPDLFAALVLGGLSTMLSVSLATAVVVGRLQGAGAPAGAATPTNRALLRRIGPLLATTLPGLAVLAVLGITVIGIPPAIWLAVRWSYVGPVVMLEHRTGLDAYRRSGALARNRWFRTAAVVLVVSAILNGTGALVSLAALVLFTGLPLWALAAIGSAAHVLLVPVAGLIMGLLHGDAVATEDAEPLAARPPVAGPGRAPGPVH